MPIYFTGQTGPALPLNSVQVNTSGIFAGDANFTWIPASGLIGNAFARLGPAASSFNADNPVAQVTGVAAYAKRVDADATYYVGLKAFVTQTPTVDHTSGYTEALNVRLELNGIKNFYGGFGTESEVLVQTSGNVTGPVGAFQAYAEHSGAGTIAQLNGVVSLPYLSGPGTVTRQIAFKSLREVDSGLVTESIGFHETGVDFFGGTITTNYAIKIEDQTVGGTNYALHTGAGLVQFGDTFQQVRANGQTFAVKTLTELTTIAAAATTDTAIQIPANAVVFGVDVRVTVAIPTAATFTVIGASSSTVFNTAAVTVAANSTDKGTKSCPFYNATAQAIRITPDIQPGANSGRVRVTIHYYEVVAATS